MAISFQIECNWQDERSETREDKRGSVFVVNELEQLCFKCNLPDCKEDSKKCPIRMVKVIGLEAVQAMLNSK